MELPPLSQALSPRSRNATAGLFGGLRDPSLPKREVATQLFVSLLPALSIAALLARRTWRDRAHGARSTLPDWSSRGGAISSEDEKPTESSGVQEPPHGRDRVGLQEPPKAEAAACRSLLPSRPHRRPPR